MPTKTSWSTHLLLLLTIIFAVFSFTNYPHIPHTYQDYTTLSDNFENAALKDSLPQVDAYKAKIDSLIRLDVCTRSQLTNRGSGIITHFGGYTVIREPEDCSNITAYNYTGNNHYYLAFSGYRLRDNTRFHIRNGQYYLEKPVWSKNADGSIRMERQNKPVDVRYVQQANSGLLLFPISYGQFKFIRVLSFIVAGAAALVLLFLLVLLARIFMAITKGNDFNERNVRYLNIIGWALVAFALVPNIMALIFSFVLSSYIPRDIYIPAGQTLLTNSWLIVAGLVMLLVRNAFKSGVYIRLQHQHTY